MYKLGFFYNLPANVAKNNALFLCYENQGFRFYFLKKHMLPRKYQDIHSNYYSFCYPVICRIIDDEINKYYEAGYTGNIYEAYSYGFSMGM